MGWKIGKFENSREKERKKREREKEGEGNGFFVERREVLNFSAFVTTERVLTWVLGAIHMIFVRSPLQTNIYRTQCNHKVAMFMNTVRKEVYQTVQRWPSYAVHRIILGV